MARRKPSQQESAGDDSAGLNGRDVARHAELPGHDATCAALLEQVRDGVVVVQDGVCRYANPAAAEMGGYQVEKIVGKPLLDFVAPESREEVLDRYRKRMEGKPVPAFYEASLLRKDGTAFVAEISASIMGYGGRPADMMVVRDITERKRAEEELRASREYSRSLVDSSLDMIISVDQDRRIVEFNRAAEETFGYSKTEVLGRRVSILYADPAEGRRVHETVLRTGRFAGEIANKRKNGEVFPSYLSASILSDSEGRRIGVMGVSRDISEIKRGEERINQQNRDMTGLHQALTAMTQTFDVKEVLDELVSEVDVALDSAYTSVTMVNEDGSLGIDSDTFRGVPPLSLGTTPPAHTRGVIESGKPVVVDDVDGSKDIDPLLLKVGVRSFAGVPIVVNDEAVGVLFVHSLEPGAFAGRLALLKAFAEQAPIAIENARLYGEAKTVAALQEADRMKTELLSNVSHELRTPLASIKGYCSSLLRFFDRLPEEDRLDSLNEINQASDRLNDLVENLLQMSRLEMTVLRMEKEPMSIPPVFDQAVADMERKAAGHRFVIQCDETVPAIKANPGSIRQVLDNLLTNAVKYSPEGTTITVSCHAREAEVVISVRDEGRGISKENLEKVFERFFQETPGIVGGGRGWCWARSGHFQAHRGGSRRPYMGRERARKGQYVQPDASAGSARICGTAGKGGGERNRGQGSCDPGH